MESETREIEAAIGSLGRLTDLFQRRRLQLARGVGLTVQQWRVLEEVSTEHFLPSLFEYSRANLRHCFLFTNDAMFSPPFTFELVGKIPLMIPPCQTEKWTENHFAKRR